MTHLVLALIFLLLGCGKTDTPQAAPPAQTAVSSSQETDSPAMFVASLTSYEIGIMRKGPKWSSDAPAKMKEISKKNGEPWRQAAKEGSLVGLAQIVDPKEIVAIFFFKNKTARVDEGYGQKCADREGRSPDRRSAEGVGHKRPRGRHCGENGG